MSHLPKFWIWYEYSIEIQNLFKSLVNACHQVQFQKKLMNISGEKIQNNDFGPKKCPIYLNMAMNFPSKFETVTSNNFLILVIRYNFRKT